MFLYTIVFYNNRIHTTAFSLISLVNIKLTKENEIIIIFPNPNNSELGLD